MSQDTRDPAAEQLSNYAETKKSDVTYITTSFGTPVTYKDASETVGVRGPTLLQDWELIDELAHFSRERIPERVVHAKGAGAFGYFEVTHDITQYSAAKVFSHVGKRTPVAVRFSQVFGEMGYADTVRDVRGFAVKFYTDDGIWDLVGNNTPVFFIRDAILFPSFIHILKRNPATHLKDWDMFWDMITLRQETIHQLLILYSDRGIPASYRKMHGYGSNTYSLINNLDNLYWCKFHYKTNQGIQNLNPQEAARLAGTQPDYLLRDLYDSIASKDFPSWTLYIQIMTPSEAANNSFDPFDVTKVWPQNQYPLIPVGKLTLNRNPKNYFAEVEQLAFDPAHLPPGINASPDRMLQGRLFNYGDTHRYRLGINSIQLPVNAPISVHNFSRDGSMVIDNQGGAPNYHPNTFSGPKTNKRAGALASKVYYEGDTIKYDTGTPEWDNYGQAKILYKNVLKEDERKRLADNIVQDLKNANESLQKRAVKMFSNVDEELAKDVSNGLIKQKSKHADL